MEAFRLLGKLQLDGNKKVQAQLASVGKSAKSADSKLTGLRKGFAKLGKIAAGATAVAGTAIAALGASGIKAFTGFDQKIREVYTLIPDASEEMREELSTDIRELGEQYGMLSEDTVPALYQALSAGVPPDNVMDFMDTAAQSAKAGVTDLETSVDGLTSVVNAYGEDVINAQEASDILFTTVKEGKTTFPELSDSISTVTPVASALGIAFDDVSAAIATMTAQGMQTQKATRYLRSMLNQLSKEGSDVNKVFQKVADQGFVEFMASGHDMADALQLIQKYAEENNTSVKKLFGNIRAGTGALQLTGSNMDTFIENMDAMEESAGSTEEAYKEMSSSVQQTLDELRAWWENQRIKIGEDLEGQFRDLLKFLKNNEDEISSLIKDIFSSVIDGMKWIKNNKRATVDAIEAIGAAFVGWKIGSLVSNLWGLVAVLGVIGGLGIAKAINKIADAFGKSKTAIEQHKESAENAKQAESDLKDNLYKMQGALSELQKEYENLDDKKSNYAKALKSNIENLKDQISAYENKLKNVKDIKQAEEEATETTRENKEETKGLGETMGDLRDSIDDAHEQSKLFEDEQRSLSMSFENTTRQMKDQEKSLETIRKQLSKNISTTEEAKGAHIKINKVRQNVQKELDKITEKEEYLGDQYDEQEKKVALYKTALNTLRKKGIEPTSDIVKEYQQILAELTEETENQTEETKDQITSEERLGQVLQEIEFRHEKLGEDINVHRQKASALKSEILRLVNAEGDHKERINELLKRYKDLQDEIKETKSFWEKYQSTIMDLGESFKNVLEAMMKKSEDWKKQLADDLDEIAQGFAYLAAKAAGASNATANAVAKATNWLVDLGKAAWDWLFGPSKAQKRINEIAKQLKDTIASGLSSAFSADTYSDFVNNFGTSIEEAVKSSMIKAFMATEAMKSKMKKLSKIIAEATAPGSAGGYSITEAERARIKQMAESIAARAKPVYEAIKDLDLGYSETGEGETKTGTFGSAPGGGGGTTTIQTENITPDVIERLGDTVKGQGQNIVKELEKQTNLLNGESGKTEVTLKLDREVLARKIFELKQTRLKAMGTK